MTAGAAACRMVFQRTNGLRYNSSSAQQPNFKTPHAGFDQLNQDTCCVQFIYM